MFHFLNIAGLLAIAGIALPVAIHLWNKKQGKTLKIGSVQLLVETARQQARSFRIKDILLLILRCCILILLAMLLAKPVWQKQLSTSDKKGWVILGMQTAHAYKNYKRLIDSLRLAGFETHQFHNGFPLVNLDDTARTISTTDTTAYWPLLKELNEQVPNDLPVYLITTKQLKNFNGTRPAIAMNLQWLTYTDANTSTGNTVAARLLTTDSIAETIAHSTDSYTTYASQNKLQLQKPVGANNSVAIDTSILRISIMTDAQRNDAAYLEAALNAIRQFGNYRMQIETTTDASRLASGTDWVFWLSQKTVPVSIKTNNLFLYANGKEQPVYSWLEKTVSSWNTHDKIAITKGVLSNNNSTGEIIWSNGFGAPMLSLVKGRYDVYNFYSRFDPAWNGIVWSELLPQLLFELLFKRSRLQNVKDNRIIDTHQMQPELLKENDLKAKQKFIETTDLSKWIWTLAFLFFTLERMISLINKKETNA